jgi:hypothetical protein
MHMTRTRLVAVFAVLTSLAGPPALSVSAQTRLASAKTMRCSLQRQSTGTWDKDGVAAADVKPASLTLRFESIDGDAGTAQLRNGAVSTEVTVRLAGGYLHFMQAFRTGPLYTTTVFEAGATGGKYKAVHSRHEYFTTPLPGATSSPEQYYGECEAIQ